jgi:hypothetical protein
MDSLTNIHPLQYGICYPNTFMQPYFFVPPWTPPEYDTAWAPDILTEFVNNCEEYLEQIPDPRERRQGKDLTIWRRKQRKHHIKLNDEVLSFVIANARTLSLEDNQYKNAYASVYVITMQKALVLASPQQKIDIITALSRFAKRLLYHDGGCYVASQLVQEGNDLQVRPAAMHFMEQAHDFFDSETGVFEYNLKISIYDTHANHALRIWISLWRHTDTVNEQHVQTMFRIVEENAVDMAMDCQGVRTVNQLLLSCGEKFPQQTKKVLEVLLDSDDRLRRLINHEYGNFAITQATDFMPQRIYDAVLENFEEYVLGQFSNHVVQHCINTCTQLSTLREFDLQIRHHSDAIIEKRGNLGKHTLIAMQKALARADGYKQEKRNNYKGEPRPWPWQ